MRIFPGIIFMLILSCDQIAIEKALEVKIADNTLCFELNKKPKDCEEGDCVFSLKLKLYRNMKLIEDRIFTSSDFQGISTEYKPSFEVIEITNTIKIIIISCHAGASSPSATTIISFAKNGYSIDYNGPASDIKKYTDPMTQKIGLILNTGWTYEDAEIEAGYVINDHYLGLSLQGEQLIIDSNFMESYFKK